MSGAVPKIRNRPRIVSPCASLATFSSPTTPRSLVNPRPEMSNTRRDGVLTRTADAKVASSSTAAPDETRAADPSSGVRLVSAVTAPLAPTSSPPAHTASALSTAVELASCTTSQSRVAPDTSTSNGAAATRGAVCPTAAPRALIGVTNRAAGGGGSSPIMFRAPRSSQFDSRSPFSSSSACSIVAVGLRVVKT